MKLLRVLSYTAVLLPFVAFSQTKPFVKTLPYDSASVPREHNLDFLHLRLEASFVPQEGKIVGTVTHTFTPIRKQVDTVFLDAPDIKIKEIIYHGKSLPYTSSPDGITLRFEKSLTWDVVDSVRISYEAFPRKGLYFIGWNDPTNRCRKQIWSQGQGTDNRNWIPMYDEMNDKVTSEMIITMPKPFKVLSNGEKLSETDKGNDKVWHYRMNHRHAPYLIMLGIGEYEIETRRTESGVTENLWYYPDWKERVNNSYKYSTEMIDFFEKEIGIPYPWEQYSQIPVQEFMYGAMENTTATVFGDFFFPDDRGTLDRNYIGVNAHELAHQWFGDMVTAKAPTHHWLQESFATHYNMLYEREVFGQDHFDQARRNAQLGALGASTKDLYPIAHSKAGSTRWYPKGAVVIEMLKYIVGREAFNRTIKHYLQRHPYGNVDTEDLLEAFQETTGESLDWFWEQWLYRGGEPFYKVQTATSATSVMFIVKQGQEAGSYTGYFRMPFNFEVHYTDGTFSSKTKWVEGKETTVDIILDPGKAIAYTLFDPGNQVIKAVEFVKPFGQLKAQALTAKYMLDRLDAVIAMIDLPLNQKREVLHQVYARETWFSIKELIIDQLKKDENKKSRAILKSAASDKDVKVRKALIGAYDTIPLYLIATVEGMLLEPSYELQEDVLKKLCLIKPEKITQYLEKTKSEKGNNAKNVRITWLRLAIKNGQKDYEAELTDYSSQSFEFNTRRNALNALKDLKIVNEQVIRNAWEAAKSPNGRLAGGSIGFLSWAVKENPAWKTIFDNLIGKDLRPAWQNEIIEKINR